jgi:hypothetical protein
MNWTAITAISTFLAVLTALFIHFFQYFQHKKIRLRIYLATKGRFSKDKKAYVVLSNLGMIPETIVRILIRDTNGELTELQQDFDLPKTLRPHEVIHLDSPYLAHNLDKIKEIFAEDSTGTNWKCQQNSIEHSRKILKHFVGRGINYPEMGDEMDEDKLA